jgi:hypothetical protein
MWFWGGVPFKHSRRLYLSPKLDPLRTAFTYLIMNCVLMPSTTDCGVVEQLCNSDTLNPCMTPTVKLRNV